LDMEEFISMHTMPDQHFDCTGEYYTLHKFDLDSYDRRFAIIDCRRDNERVHQNKEFNEELARRVELLKSQGFVFIKSAPWESPSTVALENPPPHIEIEHVKWTGDCSWFWWYMYRMHKDKQYVFDHTNKEYEFLYLNKTRKPHRQALYDAVNDSIKKKSLVSFWPKVKLESEFEDNFPYPERGNDQNIVVKQYNKTKYSLLSESTVSSEEIFMTERLWKSIIAEHIFVVHGNPLYLQKLREMGFKTFSNYFDETYDIEFDNVKRIEKIVATCDQLQKSNWQDIYLQSQKMRKHNKNHFFDKQAMGKEINKTLDLFLEFADRS